MKMEIPSAVTPGLIQEVMLSLMRSSPAGLAILDESRTLIMVNPKLCSMCDMSAEILQKSNYLSIFGPEDRESVALCLDNPTQSTMPLACQLMRPNGQRRQVEVKHFSCDLDGRLLTALVVVDVTEERLLLSKLGTLSQFVSSLTYAGSLSATLDRLCEKVVENTEAVACSIVVVDHSREKARFLVGGSHGLDPANRPIFEAALNSDYPLPPRQALETGKTIILHNLRCRLQEMLENTDYPELQGLVRIGERQSWSTAVCVPILFNGQPVGTLNCYYSCEAQTGDAETTFLQTLADLAAVTIENARLLTQAEEKAALEERQRLARELHDSVAQAIYGISLGLKTAKAQLERDPGRAHKPIDYALGLAEGATKEMRALIFSLRPETLDEEGLVRALERHVDALRARYHLEVETAFVAEPQLDSKTRHALFRVASEALHNVVKHAKAKTVRISLCAAPRTCSLDVHDDGIGFDPSASFPGHLGLRSMKERIEAIGGTFTMHSERGHGTRLMARVPLAPVPVAPG